MNSVRNALFRHWALLIFLVLYAALLLAQVDRGLASGDAHGIVRATQTLVESGRLEVSRPPGHPTTEFYLFGATGWVLKNVFDHKFDDETYLVCQALAALATLMVFYELLCHLGANRNRAFLATVCLAFSAQFFSNAVDGEEFVFAILFLLLAVRLLIVPPDSAPTLGRLVLSIFCFALATGCRPEIIFSALIFPIYCLLRPGLGWKYAFATLGLQAAALILVWLPILVVGIRAPYAAGMNLRESLLGGAYRIVFQSFTPAVFLVLCWVLISAWRDVRARLQSRFPDNFVFTSCCLMPVIFVTVFFLHPSKAAHLLPALPFLLILAVGRSLPLLLSLTILTAAGSVINIDIFKDRQLHRPFLVAGGYFQGVHQKPYYKLHYLADLFEQCENGPVVVIGNAWPWDFEYHMVHTSDFSVREEILHGRIKGDIRAFIVPGDHCVFLPPDAAFENALLQEWHQKGYAMKMDAAVYRTLFERYHVCGLADRSSATVGSVAFSLFHAD